jgi:hypothetical protein
MRGHPPPAGWPEPAWCQSKPDSFALLAALGAHAAALGWRTEELFHLDSDHPLARVAASGLARFIHGRSVVEITDHLARIQRQSGVVLTYRRTGLGTSSARRTPHGLQHGFRRGSPG